MDHWSSLFFKVAAKNFPNYSNSQYCCENKILKKKNILILFCIKLSTPIILEKCNSSLKLQAVIKGSVEKRNLIIRYFKFLLYKKHYTESSESFSFNKEEFMFRYKKKWNLKRHLRFFFLLTILENKWSRKWKIKLWFWKTWNI